MVNRIVYIGIKTREQRFTGKRKPCRWEGCRVKRGLWKERVIWGRSPSIATTYIDTSL